MKISLKDLLQLVIFTTIGGFILWLLWQSQAAAYLEDCELKNIPKSECSLSSKLISDFRSTNIYWILAVCVVYMLGNFCRALRWNQMLEPLGIIPKFWNSLLIIMIAYFTNLGVPRSGEFVRAGLLSKYESAPVEKVFGTIILDRILDVICLLFVLFLGFLLAFEVLWEYTFNKINGFSLGSSTLYFMGLGVSILIVVLLSFFIYFKKSKALNSPILSKLAALWIGLVEGIKSIRKIQNIPLFLFYTFAIWMSYFLMTYWMFFSYEPTSHLGLIDGLMVFDFGSLGIVFPSPGGMGTYHAMVVEALKMSGVNPVQGFSFAMIIFFTINVFCNILFGLLGLVLLPVINRKK